MLKNNKFNPFFGIKKAYFVGGKKFCSFCGEKNKFSPFFSEKKNQN